MRGRLGLTLWAWFAVVLAIAAWEGNIGKFLACIISPATLEVVVAGSEGNVEFSELTYTAPMPTNSGTTPL